MFDIGDNYMPDVLICVLLCILIPISIFLFIEFGNKGFITAIPASWIILWWILTANISRPPTSIDFYDVMEIKSKSGTYQAIVENNGNIKNISSIFPGIYLSKDQKIKKITWAGYYGGIYHESGPDYSIVNSNETK